MSASTTRRSDATATRNPARAGGATREVAA